MPGCNWEARGDSELDVLMQAAEHAKSAHNLSDFSPALIAQVRNAIHDEEKPQALSAT
jgi:predicted small metal-binding protein